METFNFAQFRASVTPLQGGDDYPTWRCRVDDFLQYYDDVWAIIKGDVTLPIKPEPSIVKEKATDAEIAAAKDLDEAALAKFKKESKEFIQNEKIAKIILKCGISDSLLGTLTMISKPRELWVELETLYLGVDENRLHELMDKFHDYRIEAGDGMALAMSKLRLIWSRLGQEFELKRSKLPEELLINKVFHCLRACLLTEEPIRPKHLVLVRQNPKDLVD